jgi:hypothetical protein
MTFEKISDVLIEKFNPSFLEFDLFDDNNINIVISSDCFINQTIPERVRDVFFYLEKDTPEILEKHRIYVHTFTKEELNEVLSFYHKEVE